MFGAYREGREELPRVLHVSVARYNRDLPKTGEALRFLVSIHEEGTGITWQQNITVSPEDEQHLLGLTNDLYLWSLNLGLTSGEAGDLTGYSAILFGDAASKHRRDLAMAV